MIDCTIFEVVILGRVYPLDRNMYILTYVQALTLTTPLNFQIFRLQIRPKSTI